MLLISLTSERQMKVSLLSSQENAKTSSFFFGYLQLIHRLFKKPVYLKFNTYQHGLTSTRNSLSNKKEDYGFALCIHCPNVKLQHCLHSCGCKSLCAVSLQKWFKFFAFLNTTRA